MFEVEKIDLENLNYYELLLKNEDDKEILFKLSK